MHQVVNQKSGLWLENLRAGGQLCSSSGNISSFTTMSKSLYLPVWIWAIFCLMGSGICNYIKLNKEYGLSIAFYTQSLLPSFPPSFFLSLFNHSFKQLQLHDSTVS